MPNSRKILIVDDDAELRGGLLEQLALHDEFEAIAVESGTKGVKDHRKMRAFVDAVRAADEA